MNIIDIILLVLVGLCILVSIKKGLLRSVVELVGFILAVPASMAGAKALAPVIYQQFFHQRMLEHAAEKIGSYGDVSAFVNGLRDTVNSLPFSLDAIGSKVGIDIGGVLNNMASGLTTATLAEQYVDSFLKPLVTLLCTGVLFLILFVLILILVKILSFVLRNSHMPHGLKEANGALGAVFGLLKGAVLVFVACTILGVVQMGLEFKSESSAFAGTIASSFVVEKVNQINPLFK